MVLKHWNMLPREAADDPIIKTVQSQVGWAFEQPNLEEDVPAQGKRDWLDDL